MEGSQGETSTRHTAHTAQSIKHNRPQKHTIHPNTHTTKRRNMERKEEEKDWKARGGQK
jgi:hypothetical protein